MGTVEAVNVNTYLYKAEVPKVVDMQAFRHAEKVSSQTWEEHSQSEEETEIHSFSENPAAEPTTKDHERGRRGGEKKIEMHFMHSMIRRVGTSRTGELTESRTWRTFQRRKQTGRLSRGGRAGVSSPDHLQTKGNFSLTPMAFFFGGCAYKTGSHV